MITIRDPSNTVTVARSDLWRVKERDDFPANASSIIEFGRKLWDLKVSQSQPIAESQMARVGLLLPESGSTNAGTLVELKDQEGKLIRSLLLGEEAKREGSSYANGRWVSRPDTKGTVYLVSENFSSISASPASWLNKDFFRVEKIKAVSVMLPEPTNSWRIYREKENGELLLANAAPGEELDQSKASSVGYAFGQPYLTDVASSKLTPEETGLGTAYPATIETFDGFIYTIKIGNVVMDGSRYFNLTVEADLPKERTASADEKPEDKEKLDKEFQEKVKKLNEKLTQEKGLAKWNYMISKWTLDPLTKPRAEWLKEKAPEPAEAGAPNTAPGASILNSLLPPPP